MELLAAGTAAAALVPVPSSHPMAQAIGVVPSAVRTAGHTSPVPANTFKLQYEPIAVYDVDRLNKILTTELAEFSDFQITYPPAKHAVQLYRVTYPSVVPELGNKPAIASGLIAVPVGVSVAIMFNAFEQYYALPGLANSAIKPEYQEPTQQLYFNEIPYEDALKQLPAKLPDMLNDDFKAAIARGASRFSRLLQESHAYRWRSVTPARVYYGGIDEVTPVFIGTLPVGYQQVIGGAEATAVDAGAQADHRGTFLYSIADQKQWFDHLLE